MLRYVILGLLRPGRAHHGYALMKAYGERSGLQMSTGNFYRELQRLSDDQLVEAAVDASAPGARRAPYRITDPGRAAFDSWLLQVVNRPGPVYEDGMMCRAVFIGEASPDVVGRLLAAWQDELWMEGKLLERDREAALHRAAAERPRALDPRPLLLARRLRHVAADLDFLDELRRAYAGVSEESSVHPAEPPRVNTGPERRHRGPQSTPLTASGFPP